MERTDFELFQKLKDFYAQPLDGCWPLRICWVPNLDKPLKHKSMYTGENVTRFRRFTYEEFLEILKRKRPKIKRKIQPNYIYEEF